MKRVSKIAQSKTFYIVISCLASIMLWFYVVSYENRDMEVNLSGLEINYVGEDDILRDRSLLVTDKDMQTVSLSLICKRSVGNLLNKSNVEVSVDLTDIRATGVYEKVYTITYPSNVDEDDIIVARKSPEFVTVNIDKLSSVPVEIRGDFEGSVAEGYMREPIIYDPETITVSGPENVVSRVSYAHVVVDRENLTKTVIGTVSFTLMDRDGNPVVSEDLSTDVDSVVYTIPVVMVKDVVLKVNLLDGGGANSSNAVVDISPKTITLSGDVSVLNGINQIVLGTVDLSSFAQSHTGNYPIAIPNNVKNLSGVKEANVTVTVKGLATKRLVTTNISFINVSEGYTPTAITQFKEVVIRGPREIIDLVDAENIRVVGDLSSIGDAVGRYSVPTTVYVDGYSEAGVIGSDYNVVVSLEVTVEEEVSVQQEEEE